MQNVGIPELVRTTKMVETRGNDIPPKESNATTTRFLLLHHAIP